jgi:lysophospholipase L1-like esterase
MRTMMLCFALVATTACSSTSGSQGSGGGGTGGNTQTGTGGMGVEAAGGWATGGLGGSTASGGASVTPGSGGMQTSSGGMDQSTGGAGAQGGASATGGSTATGGGMATGGTTSSGGASPTGGTGGAATGGGDNTGGASPTGGASGTGGSGSAHWVGTWATGPQETESSNNPPSPGLTNNTLRQIIHVSIGGTQVRLQFSNEFGNSPVTLNSVHIAKSMGTSSIDTSTDTELEFSGQASTTIQAKQAVYSDPVDFALDKLSNVAVSIAFGATSQLVTGHPGSRTTSYLASGDAVTAATLSGAATADHWYILTRLEVMADASTAAVVILGDSITDGRGSTTNGNDRWPDQLAKRLLANPATANVAVINQGIGGNQVLSGGLGPTARSRFDRDVLGQSGVNWVIVFEGVNDIGAGASADQLTGAYQEFIDKAHQAGLTIYGAPITPMAGSQYDSAAHQSVWQAVNDWIRAPGHFDGVVDMNAAVADPSDPSRLSTSVLFENDYLHMNPTGYQKMADAVDLSLFER